jgi:DegV family protein with EDD domain
MKENPIIFQDDAILTTKNLALVTDLTSGFSQAQANELGYDMISFPVNIERGEKEIAFTDGNDNNDAFYTSLADPQTTGAKTGSGIDGFIDVFERRLSEGKLVVYLGITDSMSAGMRNAALMAKQMISAEHPELHAEQNIQILPTHCVAGGLGLALRMIQSWLFSEEPHTLGELKQQVSYIGDHMAHIFTIFSYDFMKNSGRFSSTVDQLKIAVAKTMKIYPVMLAPRNGPLQPTWKKVRGDKNLLNSFIEIYADTAENPEFGEVEIDYSGLANSDNTAYCRALELRKNLETRYPNINIRMERTAPSVGCHVGPDEMSFFFLQKDIRPDMAS